MSIVKRAHGCNGHYELKTYEKLFFCDGCKMKGFGPRYICSLCGNQLHKECRYPKDSISHVFFGCSTFTFLKRPFTRLNENNRKEYSKCCDACGMDICGFSYHCKSDNLDLHPCCRNLEKKLLFNKTIFNLEAKVSSKCIWCKKKKIFNMKRDVPGWSYVSSCKKYHFHVYCMIEIVHDVYMKNGDMALERVDLSELVKFKKNKGRSGSVMVEMIKSIVKIILSVLFGDPTTLISNVVVELVMRSVQ